MKGVPIHYLIFLFPAALALYGFAYRTGLHHGYEEQRAKDGNVAQVGYVLAPGASVKFSNYTLEAQVFNVDAPKALTIEENFK